MLVTSLVIGMDRWREEVHAGSKETGDREVANNVYIRLVEQIPASHSPWFSCLSRSGGGTFSDAHPTPSFKWPPIPAATRAKGFKSSTLWDTFTSVAFRYKPRTGGVKEAATYIQTKL